MAYTAAPVPYVPTVHRLYAPLSPYGIALIRICLGLIIARHGYPKLFEGGAAGLAASMMPKIGLEPALLWAYLVGVTEFVGGLMLAFGLFTRIAAAALMIEFMVIVFVVKFANGFFAFTPQAIQPGFKGMTAGGFEFEMFLGLCCLGFFLAGGGKASIDTAIGREF
jgi:putative oxidoreductase